MSHTYIFGRNLKPTLKVKVFIGFASNVIPDNGAKHHLCDPFHLKKCFIFLLQCDFITHLQHAHSFVRLRLMLCPHMNLHAVSNLAGDRCRINIDECESDPCQNNATCDDGVNGYTCACPPGLSGPLCEINVDECESTPCLNGGRCMDAINKWV